MNDIDQKIQAALRREQTGDVPSGEPNLAEEVIIAFGAASLVLDARDHPKPRLVAGTIWATVRFLGAGSVPAAAPMVCPGLRIPVDDDVHQAVVLARNAHEPRTAGIEARGTACW